MLVWFVFSSGSLFFHDARKGKCTVLYRKSQRSGPGNRLCKAISRTQTQAAAVSNSSPVPAQSSQSFGESTPTWKIVLFAVVLVAVSGPWSRAGVALLAGIALALYGLSSFAKQSKTASKWLIQECVVELGLRIDLSVVMHSAIEGLALAAGTIIGAVVIGLFLGKILKCGREVSTLVTSGTAICGGSAIVAVGAAINRSTSAMTVATGANFILNAVGLWTLPMIGHSVGLTEVQFGQWAGVALHDIRQPRTSPAITPSSSSCFARV